MKVLQINSVCGVGSTGRIALDLYKVLNAQGHEGYIGYGRGNSPQNINSIRIGSKIDNYIHVGITRVSDRHGFASIKATEEFLNTVENLNPDVIHLHNIHGYYINIELLFNYLKSSNKPVVWTLHDCWPFTGHCTYFDYVDCDRWKEGCYNCPQKREYPSSILFDSSTRNYIDKKTLFTGIKNMTLITPSRWLAEKVRSSFLREYPIEVINNGIDLNVFKPTENSFKSDKNLKHNFVILGVASIWDERKGLKYFVELFYKLPKEYKIILVGLKEEQIKGLPKGIIGISRTDSAQELAKLYTMADVFVNPTLEDNFPTTNLEAIACATPIITFNTGGSIEVVNKNTGLITKENTTEGLLEAIYTLRNSQLDNVECLKQAKLYDKDINYKSYIKIYEEVQ